MTESYSVVVGLLVAEGSQILVQKRRDTGHLDGYWEFPGGKVRLKEAPVDALVRELQEETGLRLSKSVFERFETIRHDFRDRSVKLEFYLARLSRRRRVEVEGRWWPLRRLKELKMPEPNGPVVDKLTRMF